MCEEEAKDHIVTDNVCKVNAETGEVVQLTHFASGDGISGDVVDWLADGRIAFHYNDCIYVIPSDGGPMTELLNIGAKFNLGDFYDVRVSPSGERIAFMYGLGGQNNLRIGVVDLKTGKLRHPLRGVLARFPAWINNDCLLYSRGRRPSGFTQTWVLCLSSGRTEELTEGPLDIEPTFNARVGAIFFAHSTDRSAFLETHIWRRPMPRRLIESWFYRRKNSKDESRDE